MGYFFAHRICYLSALLFHELTRRGAGDDGNRIAPLPLSSEDPSGCNCPMVPVEPCHAPREAHLLRELASDLRRCEGTSRSLFVETMWLGSVVWLIEFADRT